MSHKPIINGITKDDTLVLECKIPEDIFGWKIRAEIYDESTNRLRFATANTGGSDDQIELISSSVTESVFLIKIPSGETNIFRGNSLSNTLDSDEIVRAMIEIEIDTTQIVAGKPEIITIFDGFIDFKQQRIKWTDPTD